MIHENRDPEFWNAIARHPAVALRIAQGLPIPDFGPTVTDPNNLPLASEHGGLLFLKRDTLGKIYEVHVMWTPEGWGAEANAAIHEAMNAVFLRGAAILVTVEIDGGFRAPLSHGWRAAGPFEHSPELAADVRTWFLTRSAWEASPARRRACRQSLSPPLSQEPPQ